jgi:outer membrane protein, heavy metal efflux system
MGRCARGGRGAQRFDFASPRARGHAPISAKLQFTLLNSLRVSRTHGIQTACLTLVIATSLTGCVHYQSRPIALTSTLDDLDVRTLLDPGLARAAEPAHLAPTWPPPTWDLQALTVAALYYNPDLASVRAAWAVARAGLVTAGQRPNPTVVDAGPGFNSSTDPRTITPWILNLDLDFTIETAGKRRHRIDLAQGVSEAARFQIAAAAWQVRTRVRQSLLDLFFALRSEDILGRQQTIQDANIRLFQRQLDAGEISMFEMAQARLQLDAIRLALADARRQQQDARVRLATAIGVPVAALDGVQLGLNAFDAVPMNVPDAAVRRAALLNRADILSALASYEASQSSLQLEISRQYPDLHLGPGFQMDQDSNKWTILGFPGFLPVFNRNQGPIAEAEARRTAAAAAVIAVQASALGAIDRALATYRAALNTLAVAEQSLGEVQTVEQTAQQQFAAGAISQLDLGIIQVERAARELARLQALVQVQQAAVDLEDAMQRPADIPVDPLPRNP